MDRQLPERANLSFYITNPSEGEDYFVVRMPFFENPKITESKKARYKKHSLLARSSNLYTYLGADSRKLNLEFGITLPHLLEEHPEISPDMFSLPKNNLPDDEKNRFKSPAAATEKGHTTGVEYRDYYFEDNEALIGAAFTLMSQVGLTEDEKEYIQAMYGVTNQMVRNQNKKTAQAYAALKTVTSLTGGGQLFEDLVPPTVPTTSKRTSKRLDKTRSDRLRLIDVVLYWVNIIRSSVINHAGNPLYGPPIIRLNHGLLYQSVPCICTDYRLDWDERAGYDLETLIPRRLNIKLSLEEIRTGDFQSFNPNDIIERDNLAGWESVIGIDQTLDPGYIQFMENV